LEKQEVHFTLFAFKWMNCLLMRELPLALVTRMWDTYLSEPEGTPWPTSFPRHTTNRA
jgi:hypothetical protein